MFSDCLGTVSVIDTANLHVQLLTAKLHVQLFRPKQPQI